MFTDVESSTSLWESHAEAMAIALELHDQILRLLIRLCRGYEVKTEGKYCETNQPIKDAIPISILYLIDSAPIPMTLLTPCVGDAFFVAFFSAADAVEWCIQTQVHIYAYIHIYI